MKMYLLFDSPMLLVRIDITPTGPINPTPRGASIYLNWTRKCMPSILDSQSLPGLH